MQIVDILTEDRIALDVEATDWRDSVKKVGEILVNSGAIEPRYIDAMIRTIDNIGAYLVIAPGVAMPHARPEDGVNEVCLGLIRLKDPVKYGSLHNDPVDIVIALGAVDHEAHLTLLKQLAEFLSSESNINEIRQAKTKQEVIAAFTRCCERIATAS